MASQFTFNAPHGRSGRRKLMYATLLVLVLFILDSVSGGSVRALLQRSVSRVWTASAQMRSAVFDTGYFSSHRSLATENASLRSQLDRSAEDAAAYEVARQENELLRALMHLAQQEKGITAPVVSSVRSSPYGTFLVGAGESDGIAVGSLVVTEGGFVVGKVSEVGQRTTLVTEVFAGGAEVDASVNGAVAPAEGRGGGNARVMMPRGIEIQEGDVVTAPQLGGRPIGLVGHIDSDTSSAEQTVLVSLPVNLASLRYIYIVPIQ